MAPVFAPGLLKVKSTFKGKKVKSPSPSLPAGERAVNGEDIHFSLFPFHFSLITFPLKNEGFLIRPVWQRQ